jgi:hypothetical protein
MTRAERSPGTGTVEERRQVAEWAAACAERILPLFERRDRTDARPREAIEAARSFARGDIRVGVARKAAAAAHPAARTATDPAAVAAARAAGHTAATAHMASHAPGVPYYVSKALLAAAPDNGAKELRWEFEHASALVRVWAFPDGPPG